MNEGTRYGTTMHPRKVVQDSDAYNPTNGRQGKSAASGRAQVVGWVETFGHSRYQAGWRFTWKHEGLQRLDRRRALLKPACAP